MMANFRQLLRRGGGTERANATKRANSVRRRVALETLESRQLMAGGLTVTGPFNASQQSGNQEETSIAINPTNTQNIVVLSNTDSPTLFMGVTFDSGRTWTRTAVAKACCDPSAAFDQFGNLFMTYIDDAITTAPVLTSTDGGKTVTTLFTIPNVSDQPKLVIGPGGSVAPGSLWVEFQDKSGQIGGVGFPVNGLGSVGTPTATELIPGSDGGNFGKPGIGPSGQVVFPFEIPSGGAGPAALYIGTSPGLSGTGFTAAALVTNVNVGGFAPIPPQPARTVDSEVETKYDFSGGPHNGRLYMVLTDSVAVNSGDTDVFLIHSDDNGATWSPRVRVNDDAGNNAQFLPRMAVDEYSGNVGVSFYDSRNDNGSGSGDTDGKPNTDAEFYATVSVDGGQTFLPNVQISNGPSNAISVGGDDNGGFDFGDFTGIAFAKNVLVADWGDNSTTLGNNSDRPNLDVAMSLVSVQSLTVTPVPFAATEDTPFTGAVATFRPAVAGIPASSFTATVNWGDGNVTAGSIVISGGTYKVVGSHTYIEGGSYPIVVSVTQLGGGTATGSETEIVQGLPFNVSGTTIVLREGDGYTGVLAHFVDTAPLPQGPGHYFATINFGDGTSGVGAILVNPAGGFDVVDQSGHVYGGGNYNLTITISDPGTVATATTAAIVADSALHSTGLDVTPTEGSPFAAPLATFTDDDPRVPPVSNYFATIDYGDGTTGPGTIIANPSGAGFAVVGNHPFSVGSYSIVVTIGNFSGGSTTVAIGTATVQDAPLNSQSYNFSSVAGTFFGGIVASFNDADPRTNSPSNYQAQVDWGDGQKIFAEIDVNEDGGYLVRAIHAYNAGTYTITTTISDAGGATTASTGIATITDAPVTVQLVKGATLSEGVSRLTTIATFDTPNTQTPASDFVATITFGDGTTGTGILLLDSIDLTHQHVLVQTDKVYDAAGTYPISVVITSPGGSQVQTTGSLTVTAAPISAQATSITGTSKTQLTGLTVATFTSANPKAVASAYSASINWGDGATTVGTVASDGLGGFAVTGSHDFKEGGIFPVVVTITGTAGGSVPTIVQSTATIDNLLFPITGGATTTTGGAISATGLTNSSTPIFTGTAEPFASVQIFATVPGGSPSLVASGKADSTGSFTLTSSPLGDGQYVITASGTDLLGQPSSSLTVLYPTASRGLLTVDTQGPKVTSARFDPRTGKVTISLADGLSGLGAGVLNAANYSLMSSTGKIFAVTGLTVTPVAPNTQQTANLTFATGKNLPKGTYVLTIKAQGVTDLAGNVLDERYFVPFPGLYNRPGQDFVAAFKTDGHVVSQPTQYVPPPEVIAAKNHGLFIRKHFRRG
jgi:Bacterial Ig-like domain/Planctomycete extracellular